jgi:p-hydroxybenzoate 3-monooxygenase
VLQPLSLRTQVAIIGSGPAGLLLQQLLRLGGVDSVILERHTREEVESRVRAGVLEAGTVALLRKAGVTERLDREGMVHAGISIVADDEDFRIDFEALAGGKTVTVYGQTELTRDLFDAAGASGSPIILGAREVRLHALDSEAPFVTWIDDEGAGRLDCDFVAGCDGHHGVSRASAPEGVFRQFARAWPFAWLGMLADVPPCGPELIYCRHDRGFALASMRSASRSRYYLQAPLDARLEDWPDERFWDEFAARIGPKARERLTPGPSIEKVLVPLRSAVTEPMRWGRVFLAGDAAHIVPPTGAKGLNLAASDVAYLAQALIDFYAAGDVAALEAYSTRALARVWKASRFSWWFTGLTHRFADAAPIDHQLQLAELDYLKTSRAAQATLAENYVGLPV